MSVRDMLMAAAGVDTGGGTDNNFENVTLLLNGDGTNGAQNNTFVDSSTNNFTITRNGNTTQGSFSPYGSNWSNYFNGSSSLSVPYNTALNCSGDFTWEFWAYKLSSSNKGVIQYRDASGGWSSGAYQIQFDSGNLLFQANGVTNITSDSAFPLNQWVHIAITRSGTTIRMYINGVAQSGTATSSTNFNGGAGSSGIFRIGKNYDGTQYYFDGYVSNYRMVNGTALYTGTSSFTPPTTPLTAVTNTALLTCQSNRFVDNSSNAFTVSVNDGSPSVQRFSPFNPTASYDTATIGGSGYFDGSGDGLTVPNDTSWQLGSSDFTIEFWMYGKTFTSNVRPLAGFTDNAKRNFLFLWRTDDNYLGFYASSSGGGWEIAGPKWFGAIRTGEWNHFRVTRSGNTWTQYLNGTSVNTWTDSSSIYTNTELLYIGSQQSNTLDGYLADVRIIKGTALNGTVPTAPLTAVTNTAVLTKFTNAGISDSAMMNDLETVGNAQVSTSVKKFGTGSLYFDGNGDWLKSTDGSLNVFGTGDFTIEGWAYTASYGSSTQQLVAKGGSGSSSGWYVAIRSTGKLEFGKPTTPVLTSSASVGTNAWFYFTVTRSNGTIYLFINGTLDSTISDTTNYNDTSNTYVAVFGDGSSQPLTGYIDDLRITKGYARYTANFTPPTAALPTK